MKLDTFYVIILGAIALIVATAWNNAIQTTIDHVFDKRNSLISMYVYAIILTFVLIFLTSHFSNETKR